jgi:hypothetical protein
MTAPTPEIVEMAHQFLRFSVISGSPVSFNPPDLRALLDHVAAVTAERDQAVRELAEQKRINTSNLQTMTGQLDQARQMLADAPHEPDCFAGTYDEEPCTCWKAGL